MREFKGMADFPSFFETIARKSRYIHDERVSEFLETVAGTAYSRTLIRSSGTESWRAQKSDVWETIYLPLAAPGDSEEHPDGEQHRDEPMDNEISGTEYERPCPFTAERMKPRRKLASEGRLNAKGIPFLYVADDQDTAMAETRPWAGARVTIALLRTKRELKIVDCGMDSGQPDINPPMTPEKAEKIAWFLICNAFSTPIERSDDSAEYAPTQVLAEKFRSVGFDVKYKSELGSGCNIALFDLDSAGVVEPCRLFQTKRVHFEFDLPDNVINLCAPNVLL
jgi:hypothetical protein